MPTRTFSPPSAQWAHSLLQHPSIMSARTTPRWEGCCDDPGAACTQQQALWTAKAIVHSGPQQNQDTSVTVTNPKRHAWILPVFTAVPHNLSCFLYKVGKDLSHFCMTHVKISSGFAILLKIREVENTRTSELLISNAGKNLQMGLSMNEPVNSCPQACRLYHCPSCSY